MTSRLPAAAAAAPRSDRRPPPPEQKPIPPAGALPTEGSIEPGRVVRVEPYGAFVALANYPRISGLVHISQLSSEKVQDVTDVVRVDDEVQVLVLEVTLPTDPAPLLSTSQRDREMDEFVNSNAGGNNHNRRPPRPKIRLRLHQGGRAPSASTSDAVSAHLTRQLHSSIGMGVALDPMAAHHADSNKNRLILKHAPQQQQQQQQQQLINGYALVDDTEGELPVENDNNIAAAEQPAAAPAKPMGRGRGSTLPAWMTRAEPDGITKKSNDDRDDARSRSSRSSSPSASRSSSASSNRRKHKKNSKRSHHKKHSKRKHKHHHKHKKEKKHSRQSRYDDDDDNDDDAAHDRDGSRGRAEHKRQRCGRHSRTGSPEESSRRHRRRRTSTSRSVEPDQRRR